MIGLGFFNDFFFFIIFRQKNYVWQHIIFRQKNYVFMAIEPSANKLASDKYIIEKYQSVEFPDL
jgi:hypothetical protein